jgi:hypothetical protein
MGIGHTPLPRDLPTGDLHSTTETSFVEPHEWQGRSLDARFAAPATKEKT